MNISAAATRLNLEIPILERLIAEKRINCHNGDITSFDINAAARNNSFALRARALRTTLKEESAAAAVRREEHNNERANLVLAIESAKQSGDYQRLSGLLEQLNELQDQLQGVK
jgi:hypothetical protein